MLLSHDDVRWLATSHRLLNPFIPERMGPCSYDLSVGEEYYCYQPGDGNAFKLRQLPSDDPDARCEIPPNGCAFLLTEESLNMPADLVGQVSLRFSLTKRGIMLSPQAPIDPGYCGKIMMMLYNLSDEPQFLHRGDAFVTITFTQLSNGTAPYQGVNQGVTSIRGFMKRDLPIRTSISRAESELMETADLLRADLERERKRLEDRFDEKMATLEKQANSRLAGVLSYVGLALGLLAVVIALLQLGQDGNNSPSTLTPTISSSAIPTPTPSPTR